MELHSRIECVRVVSKDRNRVVVQSTAPRENNAIIIGPPFSIEEES